MLTRVVFLCVAGMLLSACRRGCDNDQDCKGDRVCVDGECLEPPMRFPAAAPSPNLGISPGVDPQPAAPQPVEPPPPVATPPPKKPAPPPRQTCGECADDCLDKADAVRKSDPAWATHLASQMCKEECSPGTAFLLRCHSYGLLMGQGITPRY